MCASALRSRESWKYTVLRGYLESIDLHFQFEYHLPDTPYIYDLALLDSMILVEFDGEYHNYPARREKDLKKDEAAYQSGWRLVRVPVSMNQVIDSALLEAVI